MNKILSLANKLEQRGLKEEANRLRAIANKKPTISQKLENIANILHSLTAAEKAMFEQSKDSRIQQLWKIISDPNLKVKLEDVAILFSLDK